MPIGLVKKNLIANFVGQGWTGVMGLAFIPYYIEYMGIEAYGLIGLYAVLSAALNLFDMGLTPMMSREMARLSGGGHTAQSIRNLLRSVEFITMVTAIVISIGVGGASSWIASEWLVSKELPTEVVADALVIMGVVTATRFIEGVYRSCLIGLQKQILLNCISSFAATFRWGGCYVVVSTVSPTVDAFFLWQGLVSILTIVIMSFFTYRHIPVSPFPGRFSLHAIAKVWRFAGGMMAITVLSFLLTQIDKIVLSKMLDLSEFGQYTIAVTVAGCLFLLVAPIRQAAYPRLCQLTQAGDEKALNRVFHASSQLVAVLVGSVAISLYFLSEELLLVWTANSELASGAAPILMILVLGNLVNTLMGIPYQTQLAFGWTSLGVKVNAISVAIVFPALVWLVPQFGAIGAAYVWLALNLSYFFVSIQIMFLRLLKTEKWRWYLQDSIFPVGVGFCSAFLASNLFLPNDGIFYFAIKLIFVYISALFSSLLVSTTLRKLFINFLIKSLR